MGELWGLERSVGPGFVPLLTTDVRLGREGGGKGGG